MNVRVHNNWSPGHVRAPGYLREKTGEIERKIGLFSNPEQNAYRHAPEQRELLRVRFKISEVWGANAENSNDEIEAEIYSHWLEAV